MEKKALDNLPQAFFSKSERSKKSAIQENYPEEIPFKELFSVVFLIKINISRNPNLDEIESKRDTSSPIMNNHEAYKGVWNFDDEEVLEKSELRITKNISSKNP